MDGMSHQLIHRGGDSMWKSQRFGDVELEMHEGHQRGRPVASWGYHPGGRARGLEGNTGHISMSSNHPAGR